MNEMTSLTCTESSAIGRVNYRASNDGDVLFTRSLSDAVVGLLLIVAVDGDRAAFFKLPIIFHITALGLLPGFLFMKQSAYFRVGTNFSHRSWGACVCRERRHQNEQTCHESWNTKGRHVHVYHFSNYFQTRDGVSTKPIHPSRKSSPLDSSGEVSQALATLLPAKRIFIATELYLLIIHHSVLLGLTYSCSAINLSTATASR